MKIRYKKIIHERLQDAPFIGALVVGISCSLNCPGCFHEYMKDETNTKSSEVDIVDMIVSNPINKGIILAGLEWSEQPKELISLITEAKSRRLQVIVYSGLTQEEFFTKIPELLSQRDIFFKFGRFDSTLLADDYYMFGVKLASKNQKIIQT